ncbi:MAG TPA: NUDIX domain-containing protein [Ktedonobacteraceae bacterium]|jgi:8-oxo-dGTP diphosphatase
MNVNGTNIIFLNERQEVLLHLRDDKPDIPYPNRWGLPGGHIDEGETPEACILREMREELGLSLHNVALFTVADRSYGREHTYWARADFRPEDITLGEGQEIRWFSYPEIQGMALIYEDNRIIDDFFTHRPFVHPFPAEPVREQAADQAPALSHSAKDVNETT